MFWGMETLLWRHWAFDFSKLCPLVSLSLRYGNRIEECTLGFSIGASAGSPRRDKLFPRVARDKLFLAHPARGSSREIMIPVPKNLPLPTNFTNHIINTRKFAFSSSKEQILFPHNCGFFSRSILIGVSLISGLALVFVVGQRGVRSSLGTLHFSLVVSLANS